MRIDETARAIFLSSASQDAEAAGRVHDVLRAAGLEVWFDRSELRGGDAWDVSIRRQIRECALFVPIVSANTQRRTEGYFRLEWRLAEQRSHLMARGRPFLVPVVIDDTPESGAHVPDAFLDVQWTRLPGGHGDAAFAARLVQLVDGAIAAPAPASAVRPGATPSPVASTVRPVRPGRATRIAAVAILAAVAAVGYAWWQRGPSSGAGSIAAATSGVVAERVARARELLDFDPLRTRRNVELAEQLALEAVAKDPTSAEAYAAAAWANYRYIAANYEDTPQRRADLRSYAEKAKLLDPASVDAELAVCGLHEVNRDWTEAYRCLDALLARAPDNVTVLREAAFAAIRSAPDAETAPPVDARSAAILDRMRAVSPLGRSYADMIEGAVYWRRGEYRDADRLLDGTFANGLPVRDSYLLRLLVLLYGWGDLEAARAFAATIPPKLLLEDVFIYHVATLYLQSGDYDRALETLGRSQRDMLEEALVESPTAAERGNAHAAAGRLAAAALQWREAVKVLDRQLALEPDRASLHEQKATLLARLGERHAAAQEFALAQELDGNPAVGSLSWAYSVDYHLAMGDNDAAIARMDRLLQREYGRWPAVCNRLRYDPFVEPLRGDPRVPAMLDRCSRWLAEMRRASAPAVPARAGAATP
jgi:tetratricopeptide (TPR) repeat protein